MDDPQPVFDTLIRNALVVDGTGSPGFWGDVGLLDGRIHAVGDLGPARAAAVLEADGNVLAPGFIDTHTHDDRAVFRRETILPKLSQGVTTVVVGNCGISLAPLAPREDPPAPLDLLGAAGDFAFPTFAAYARALQDAPLSTNVAALVGHGTLRVRHMEDRSGPADPHQLKAMVRDVEEAMDAGARGLSTGLAYPPNIGADTAEVVALARAAAERGGRLAMHVRDEFDGVAGATREAFRCARESGAFLVLSHQKVAGRANRGRSAELLRLYGEEGEGVPFAIDAYPYTAGSTVLDPAFASQSTKVLVAWSRPHPKAAGHTLAQIAKGWGCPEAQALERLKPGGAVYFHMEEADVERFLAFDRCMVGSDGLPHDIHPHPRLWGTFARYLHVYVAQRRLLPLEEAVRRMTSLPAGVFGLEARGRVRPGCHADLVLFDPARIRDRATYEDPAQPAEGILEVFVNGVPREAGAAGRYL
ncbi:N-acyl-D-amino-acid deacylase family protein [Mesoterricola silvestris]|nr:D-aminoacylase [Mesoterricola silvestris]